MTELRAPDWPKCARCTKPCKPSEQEVHEGKPYCCGDCVVLRDDAVSQAKLRELVLRRDHGKCARCPNKCLELRAYVDSDPDKRAARVHQLVLCGFDRDALEKGHALWEADHVEPRVKGGPTTLANARTLCLPCHHEVTAELARDRAELRRPPGRFAR